MNPRTDGPTQLSSARIFFALLALAMGGFGIGATEFAAMGLLPNMAHDLLPSVYAASPTAANAQASWIIAAYALGVVVGAPTIAVLTARWSRKTLLISLVVAFTLGTIASALAPTFGLVMVARFASGLPHGAYFGIASLVAAKLMGPGKRGRGVAIVLGGLTISNIIGVPLITWLGENHGWRVAYFAVAGIFALTCVAIALLVPVQAADPAASMMRELRAFGRPQVWLALAIGAIGFGGLFAVYSYVAPLVTTVTRLPQGMVPLVLVLVGIGMTVGNFVGGWGSDRNLKRSMFVFFGTLLVGLVGLALTADTVPGLLLFLFVVAASCSALSPAIQTRIMDVASDSQSIAAALNHSALNIANALGAYLGGVTIAAGLGYISPVWVGAILGLGGVGLAAFSFRVERRNAPRAPADGRPATGPVERVPMLVE